jgi:3-methyl-2-oxobutanoate hydroxymethyltransferase
MKITPTKIKSMKSRDKIVVLTAYDFPTAAIMDSIVDIILVGDSLGMVVLGHKNTLSVTMGDMLRHTSAVAKAAKNSLVVGDMPHNSFRDKKTAMKNAKKFIIAGADAVKIEGGKEVADIAKAIIKEKIPVMGHIGLTPQTMPKFRVQGKTEESAKKLIKDAVALERAGCFSVVLECIPANLAKKITDVVKIPTIGIGAGKYCDGQVLVINDILGLFGEFKPKFVKRYANLAPVIKKAILKYRKDVKKGDFPSAKFSYR